ncbi:glycosyltransferase [uncultured Pontibacter sp.]|uniref:glycosyltransferase n=1 Tax=uncultured Pontibacter sp. TaxID=453356 RepID=UPI00262E8AFA|nr:glycosyltransferase [uncultured Pontibacter sp.]
MLISVIIPNYNHAAFLPQRLESVMNQTFDDFEVIILDDCSTDHSREILDTYKSHSKISHVVYNEKNSGSTFKQWNKGVQLAQGEWIWIAESDDKAELNFLEVLAKEIRANDRVGIAYTQSLKMNSKDEVTGSWLEWTEDLNPNLFKTDFVMKGIDYTEQFLIHKNTIPNASALLFKKEIFVEVGGADETIRNCSDWELWLKFLLVSDVLYVSQPLNYFRYHEQSVIAKALKSRPKDVYAERFDKSMRLKFQDFLLKHFNSIPFKKIARLNKGYIMQESIYEALFDLVNRKFTSAGVKLKRVLRQNSFLLVTFMGIKIVAKESLARGFKK